MTRAQMIDLAERAGWTLAEALVSVLSAAVFQFPPVWVPLIAAVLAAAKTGLAQQWGHGTGATVPAADEPQWTKP